MTSLEEFSALFEGQARTTSESPPRVSILDVIQALTRHNGWTMWQRLLRTHQDLLKDYSDIGVCKFKGRGQRDTPICTYATAHKIITLLSGKTIRRVCATGKLTPIKRRAEEDDDLYVMRYKGNRRAVKIGRARNVKIRRQNLEAGQNFRIEIMATFPGKGPLEHAAHEQLQETRSTNGTGIECFNVSAEKAIQCINDIITRDNFDPSECDCI